MSEDTFNAADETKVNQRKRKSERDREREIADLKAVMATPEGRRLMWRVLGRCGIYSQSFTGNSSTFFNCGRQDIGLWLTAELTTTEHQEAYLLMQREAMKEAANG